MADRIPLVIEGASIREIPSDDRLDVQGALEVNGHITPGLDSTYDIGTSSLKFRDIHLSSGTIHLGGVKLGLTETNYQFKIAQMQLLVLMQHLLEL